MTKKRNRKRPLLSFQQRLSQFTLNALAAAQNVPPGAQRRELLEKARESEAAAKFDLWLSSRGLEGARNRTSAKGAPESG